MHLPPLLRRDPRFTIVSVLILAVGIGACTAMFSIVHAVLLRPMALPNAARVVMLWSIDVRHDAVIESTYETQADFRRRLRSFDDVALMGSVNWSGSLLVPGREPVQLSAACVSGTFFQYSDPTRFLAGCSTQQTTIPRLSAGWCSATRRGRNSSAPIHPWSAAQSWSARKPLHSPSKSSA